MNTTPTIIKDVVIVDFCYDENDKRKEEIKDLWSKQSFGNDYYYYRWHPEDEERMPAVAKYLKENNLLDKKILIHFWW